MTDQLDTIVGTTIADARYTGEDIVLNLADGRAIHLVPEGDCCAYCFIQHVSCAFALQGATVASVEDIESVESEDVGCAVETWGHRITTDKGVCSIEMRVEHNGYYSGRLRVKRGAASDAPTLGDF